jgi:hypothetical protein
VDTLGTSEEWVRFKKNAVVWAIWYIAGLLLFGCWIKRMDTQEISECPGIDDGVIST